MSARLAKASEILFTFISLPPKAPDQRVSGRLPGLLVPVKHAMSMWVYE
jgi:hypothetical protein